MSIQIKLSLLWKIKEALLTLVHLEALVEIPQKKWLKEGKNACSFNYITKATGITTYARTNSTGRIQCEVLTTLPFCFSWIKKFLGQQSKIWDDSSAEKLFR